jgi:hypothetical protein
MVTGRMFRLKNAVLAVEATNRNGHPTADYLPSGAVIRVTGGPTADKRMVDVQWEDKRFRIFTVDIEERGEEVKTLRAGQLGNGM